MSKQIFEETGTSGSGPHRGHAAGDTDIQKQASQLASDVKYKVKKGMSGATNMNPAQVAKAYLAQLAKSPAPPAVKALAKKKLIGEEYTSDIDTLVKESLSKVLNKVFVEGVEVVEEQEENEYVKELQEKASHGGERLYHIRVTDKKTGNTYTRNATRAKIAELRSNPNISSVEMTALNRDTESETKKGESTAKVKSGKGLNPGAGEEYEDKYGKGGKNTVGDLDKDGTKEPDRHEYAGVKDNAIKKAIGKKKFKEEFIGEVKKDENEAPKVEGLKKGKKNNVKMFPEVSEAVNSETKVASSSSTTSSDEAQKIKLRNKQMQFAMNRQRQTMQLQKQGKLPLNYSDDYIPNGDDIQEVAPPGMEGTVKAMKKHREIDNPYALAWWMKGKGYKSHRKSSGAMKEESCGCESEKESKSSKETESDPREIPTKVNLVKNKLRAMGLKMSYEPEGEVIDERTRERKGQPRPARDRAMEIMRTMPSYRVGGMTRSGGTIAGHEEKRGVKKKPGAPTPQGETTADRLAQQKARKAGAEAMAQRHREEEDRRRRLA